MDDKQEPGKGGGMLPTPCSLGGIKSLRAFACATGVGSHAQNRNFKRGNSPTNEKKEEIKMKFRFFYARKPKLVVGDAANFTQGDYVCRFLLQTMKRQPVAISQHSDPNMDIWRVQHSFSCVYFGTYTEAMNYCRERFCDLDGKLLSKAEVR